MSGLWRMALGSSRGITVTGAGAAAMRERSAIRKSCRMGVIPAAGAGVRKVAPAPQPCYDPYGMAAIVEISHLDFAYGQQLVLKHINLQIEAGSTLGLIRPHRGGETTLMRVMLRVY